MTNKMAILFLILTLFIITTSVFGQHENKIDSIFEQYDSIPGCAVAVFRNEEIVFKKGYGLANLDYDLKITPATVFDIGSVAKQFTAACIVLLENDGKLSFDDNIRKYIPELPKIKGKNKITIQNLLNHTSGYFDYEAIMTLKGISRDDVFNEKKALKIIIDFTENNGLQEVSKSDFNYSNSNYVLLAVIIRRITGLSIGEYAKEKIFDPLDMKHTFIFEDAHKVVKNRAVAYKKRGVEYKRHHHFDHCVGGPGKLYSTVEDFFKWNENFKTNKIGNETFLEKMNVYQNLHHKNLQDTISYGYGQFFMVYNGLEYINHPGGWGGFSAIYMRFTKEDFGVVVLSNNAGFDPEVALKIVDIYIGNEFINKEGNSVNRK